MEILKTPLHALHVAAGAKMAPFAGYDMPIRYTGDTAEHLLVRQKAGLFDVSHMGEFLVRGPKALDLIQRISSNDASKLTPGKAQYSCMPNREGGIVDDIIVYCLEPELYMVVVNAANVQKDWNWFVENNKAVGAALEDISGATSLLALSGPAATAILEPLTGGANVGELPYYGFKKGTVAGISNVLISTTGYTGERTYELFVRNEDAAALWNALLEAGKPHGLEPTGLAARDTLRLEMGYMLYGNDIDDTTSPLEAGLAWITKLDKGTDFSSIDIFRKQKAEGLKRRLVGFTATGRGIPRGGMVVQDASGKTIGRVTSGTFSPLLKIGLGLAYVDAGYEAPGTEIFFVAREPVAAVVAKPPFVSGTSLSAK